MNHTFTYFDFHTHKKYKDQHVFFMRNAFHHLTPLQLNAFPYYFSVGLHPWDVHSNEEASLNRIKESATHPRCLAIGECGLDYFIQTDRSLQLNAFTAQIELANELNKPLVVHCVRAYHDLPRVLKTARVPVILHQYTGNEQITNELLKFPNVYFSFGKQLFSSHFNIQILSHIPIQRILLETDQMSVHIEEVYEQFSLIADMDFEELVTCMKDTSSLLFPEL